MHHPLRALILPLLLLTGCSMLPEKKTPVAPAHTPLPGAVVREFEAAGIRRVILRAGNADSALVTYVRTAAPAVKISGSPFGGAPGYHPADPTWRESPAAQWGLDFETKRYGTTLVISTVNEISYIHHQYRLETLQIDVPEAVRFIRKVRQLDGQGAADLSPP
jgi:hypothetical protein